MAVPEGERRPCKMDVFMHELDLVTYTLQITRNEKIFLPEYKGCVTDDIVETAKNIYIDSWDANNIRVQKRGDSNWEERIQNCVRNIGKGWWNKEDWSVFLTILKTGICRKSVKKENIYLM